MNDHWRPGRQASRLKFTQQGRTRRNIFTNQPRSQSFARVQPDDAISSDLPGVSDREIELQIRIPLIRRWYEVIRIKRAPAEEKFGKFYPERELYPSSAKNSLDWGTIAWSWGRNQKEQAFSQFKGLAAQYGNAYPKENQTLENEI